MKCTNPRKAHRLMSDFLNYASDLFCGDEKIEILLKKGNCFCAESVDCVTDYEELEIEYNLDQIWDDGMTLFRNFWISKVPTLEDFANITLTLLHELGHLETSDEVRKTFSFQDRALTWEAINLLCDNDKEKNYQYFAMFDEAKATQWGIDWLADERNKKVTKEFEKKFLACFQ